MSIAYLILYINSEGLKKSLSKNFKQKRLYHKLYFYSFTAYLEHYICIAGKMTTTDTWSNNSHYKVLNSEYGDLLSNLKTTVLRLTCPQKIDLCKAWIQRFLKCAPHEDGARNYLIHKLTQQLLASTDANLEYPFTVIANTEQNSLQDIVDEIRRRKIQPISTSHAIDNRFSQENINQLQMSDEDCQFIGSDCVAQIQDLNRFITEITEINKNLTKELENTKRERDELRITNAKWQKEYEESVLKRQPETNSFDRYLSTCDSCGRYKAKAEQANGDVIQLQEALRHSRWQQNEEKSTNCKKICNALNTLEKHLLSASPLENLRSSRVFSQIFDNEIISEDIKSELAQREERIGHLFGDIVRSVQTEEPPAGATLVMITKKYKRRYKQMFRKLLEQESKIANMQRDDAIKEKAHAIRYATLKSEIVLQNGAKQRTDLGNLISSLDSQYRDLIDKNLQLDDSFVV